jgi:hypothetical protein
VTHKSAATLEEFGRTGIYLIALAREWLLFIYVALGLGRQVTSVREIIDESSWTFGRWCLYAAIAVGAAVVRMACGFVLAWFFVLAQRRFATFKASCLAAAWKRRYGWSSRSAQGSAKSSFAADFCSSRSVA